MKSELKFNTTRCLAYINSIEDFTIEFERKPGYDERSRTFMYVGERVKVKEFLKKFLLECKKESAQADYDFMKWLDERKLLWKGQQYRIIGSLNDRMMEVSEEDKQELQKKIFRYLNFYSHNYKVIEMIESDVLNNLEGVPSDNNNLLLQDAYTCGERSRTINSFDQLFKDERSAEPYFQLLRDHEYPLIGSDCNYVSRALKSGFCIWIYEMQRQQVITHQPDKMYVQLLLKKITGLKSFDVSIFRKVNNKAEQRYKEYFTKNIANIKQAQDSQPAHL